MAGFNVPFRIHRSGFYLIAVCCIFGFQIGGIQFALPVALALLASLLLHEFGHMSVATLLGVPVREFGLRFAGAYNRRAYATRRRDEILISAAGPMANIVLSIPVYFFLPVFGHQLAFCNLLLGIINLLPLPSSDGQRIIRMLRKTGTPIEIALGPAVIPSQSEA